MSDDEFQALHLDDVPGGSSQDVFEVLPVTEVKLDDDKSRYTCCKGRRRCRCCGWCCWGPPYAAHSFIRVCRLLVGVAFALADAAFVWGLYFSCAAELFPRAVVFGGAGAFVTLMEWVHAACSFGPPREAKSIVRYFVLLRALVHTGPMFWVVGDFMMQEGPTTMYIVGYALALMGALILSALWRLTQIKEAGNFFPRIPFCKRQRLYCGIVEEVCLAATIAFIVLASLLMFDFGPWDANSPRSVPHALTGPLATSTYIRTDVYDNGACAHTYSNETAPGFTGSSSTFTLPVRRYGLDIDSGSVTVLSYTAVSAFGNVSGSASARSSDYGRRVGLARSENVNVCALGASVCSTISAVALDSRGGSVSLPSHNSVNRSLLVTQVCTPLTNASAAAEPLTATPSTSQLRCACDPGAVFGVTNVLLRVDSVKTCDKPGRKWWMYE